MTVRILLADDHPVLRAGLRALIGADPGLEVVGEAGDGEQAVRLAEALAPDVVILDLMMPGLDGIEATQQIVERQPGASVLVLTASDEISLLRAAIRAGAAGYVIKRVAESELVQAIHAITRGDVYVHSTARSSPVQADSVQPPALATPPEALTPREMEVLRLIALGYTNPDMASELKISVRTVESHRANLMDKLDLHSRIDLVRYAHEQGVTDPTAA